MSEENLPNPRKELRATIASAVSFVIAAVGAVGFAIVYTIGERPMLGLFNQALGTSLMLAFGGLGAGLVFWAHGLMPHEEESEERPFHAPNPEERREMVQTFQAHTRMVGRRRLLGRLLMGALATVGIAALFPLRSLHPGPKPHPERRRTGWEAGRRVVTEHGEPVSADQLAVGGVATVFPEDHIHEADAQVILVRVPEALFDPLPGREDWSPRGHIAYSKVCTHAGCPVGLYQVETQRLFCPCHQTAFEVLRGAKPIFGPATRPLPQLPLAVDAEGFLVARDDFDEPVGPGYWTLP